MSTRAPYDPDLYDIAADREHSARRITGLVVDLVHPASVLDLGCSQGGWLRAFHDTCGISDLTGVDGEWVDLSRFACPTARFVAHDLNQPIDLGRQFDLVVSVEVAEHLRPESADGIVDSIARHGKVVAFSAAIPYQGGQNHLNEQWPGYWVERFRQRHFLPVDCFRRTIWDDDHILWWYAQNLLLFVHENRADAFRDIRGFNEAPALVHPKLHTDNSNRADLRTRPARALASALLRRFLPGRG
jgi:SAM-dependent methyltransferase